MALLWNTVTCMVLVFGLYVNFMQVGYAAEQKCAFTANSLWQTCGQENSTESECKSLDCCFAPKSYLQIKNITWRCLKTLEKKEFENGTCAAYDGPECGPSLQEVDGNVTTLRYIDNKFGMEKTDEIFGKFFDAARKTEFHSEECSDLLYSSMCRYGMPKCRDDNTSQPICREDCDYIVKICGADFSKYLGIIQYITIQNEIEFSHLIIPDCKLLTYSFEVDDKENKSCGYLFEGIDRSPPIPVKAPKNTKIMIYAGIGAAGLLIVTVAIAIVCFVRHKAKKQKYNEMDLEFLTSMTSIRDRLRQDSTTNNPLLDLLASSKPGDLVQYPLDCVEYIQDLGEGQFGKVFQGRVHGVVKGEESTDVAVKCLKEGSNDQALESFNQEVALMSVLQHPNVLKLLAVSTEEEPYCMIFEFMENGDLNEYLRKWKGKERLVNDDLIKICKHVACGMEYLASKKFLHRDLATRNCLVGGDLMVKIADFGMSRNIYHSDYYRVGGEAMLPIRWMPPEAVLYGKFTVAADVYSYGVVMWEVFSFALQPFYGYSNEEVVEFIKKGVLLPMPENCPEWIYDIMLLCWKRDTEERVTFTEVCRSFKDKNEDYDIPKSLSDSNHDYDQVEASSSSNYDQPKTRKSITTKPNNNIPTKNSLTKMRMVDPRYQNLKIEKEPERNSIIEAPATPPYVTTDKITNPHYHNISPSSTDGEINQAFENDDEKKLMKDKRASVSSKDRTPRSSLTPSMKIRATMEAKTARRSSNIDQHTRAASLGGGKSIKDVLKNETRYVKTEDEKRLSNGPLPASGSNTLGSSPTYKSALSPSSEFLEYHDYGRNIQSNDPDERFRIKKLIDQSTS